MVQKCCVPQCTSKVGDLDIYGIKIRFHRMPHTADRFMAWCVQITDKRRFNPLLSSGSRVCSKHFRKEDYVMKKPFGQNPLKLSAEPCIFKWNSACFEEHEKNSVSGDDNHKVTTTTNTETNANLNTSDLDHDMEGVDDLSSSILTSTSSIARTAFVYDNHSHNLKVHRDTQCSILDEKLIAEEISRKNSIIEQLLGKISLMETEQKSMQNKISELRAANTYYETQIRDINQRNQILEQKAANSSKLQNGIRHHHSHHHHSSNGHHGNGHGHGHNGHNGHGHGHGHGQTQSSQQQLQQATTASYRHSTSQPELPESDHDSYYDEDDIYIGPKTKKSRAMYVHKL